MRDKNDIQNYLEAATQLFGDYKIALQSLIDLNPELVFKVLNKKDKDFPHSLNH